MLSEENTTLSKTSYFLLWLNSVFASTAVLANQSGIAWMGQLDARFFGIFAFAFLFEYLSPTLGYYIGYKYQCTGRQISKTLYYLWVLVLGMISIGGLSESIPNFDLVAILWLVSRALPLRTVWLVKIREGYLFIFMYAAVVFACTSYTRPIIGIHFVLILLHFLALFIGIYSLFRDQNKNRRVPILALTQGITASMLLVIFFVLVLPSTKLWDFQVFPQHHEDGKNRRSSASLDETPFDTADTSRTLETNSQEYFLSPPVVFYIPWLWLFLIVLLSLLAMFIWHFRDRIHLAVAVLVTDPLRVAYMSDKTSYTKKDMYLLFRTYERLWAFKGIRREYSMTPLEHLFIIMGRFRELSRPSMKIVLAFHAARYGDRPAKALHDEISSYLVLRNTITPEVSPLFSKKYQQ